MAKFFASCLLILSALITGGCVQVGGDEPLIDLGRDRSRYEPRETRRQVEDPAPGVPDDELNSQERLQRDLADCQRDYESLQRRYRELENRNNQQRQSYENRIDDLEDEIEDLEDQLDD